jgi:uncharacterized protein (TIGR00730 family)
MKKLINMAVFCGAKTGSKPEYIEIASKLGLELANRGIGLVYGSGGNGLMGAVAKSTSNNGGLQVIGITTSLVILKEQGIMSPYNTHTEIKGTIHERKRLLADLADVVCVLPGGSGTLDEFADVLCRQSIGEVNKPMFVVNHEGFYDPLRDLLNRLKDEGFANENMEEKLYFVKNIDEMFEVLKNKLDFMV